MWRGLLELNFTYFWAVSELVRVFYDCSLLERRAMVRSLEKLYKKEHSISYYPEKDYKQNLVVICPAYQVMKQLIRWAGILIMITIKGYLLLHCYLALQHAGRAGLWSSVCWLVCPLSCAAACGSLWFVAICWISSLITGLTDLMKASIIGIRHRNMGFSLLNALARCLGFGWRNYLCYRFNCMSWFQPKIWLMLGTRVKIPTLRPWLKKL